MRHRNLNAVEASRNLNALKEQLGITGVSCGELRQLLGEFGFPKGSLFWVEFRRSGIIEKVGKEYFFTSPGTPIYYKRIEKVYQNYLDSANEYAQSLRERRKSALAETGLDALFNNEPIEAEQADALIEEMETSPVDSAIHLLKTLGYEIYKPIGDLWQKL